MNIGFWRIRQIRTLFLIILLITTPFPSFAAEPVESGDDQSKSKNAIPLDDVIVQSQKGGQRFSAELFDYGHPVEIITGERIRESGFVDLASAVEVLVPGVFSSSRQGRGGWTYTTLHGSEEILWLLDGVRMNNPLYGTNWTTTLSVHLIDRIEVLKGGESLFYGTGARAGVINIITKPVTDQASGEFGASYGEYEYEEVYGDIADTISGHGFMVFGSYEGYDGYQVVDDQAYRDALYTDKKHEVGYNRATVGGKYRKEFNLAGKSVLNAQLQKQQGLFDYPYPMYRNAYNDWEEEIGTLKWNHDVNEYFSYYFNSYFHTWWGKVTFTNPDGSYAWGYNNSNESVWGYEDYGANLMTSIRWPENHEFIVGIDYQNYWGKEEVMSVPETDRSINYALFANYLPYLPFSPNTKISIGGRYTQTNEDVDSTIWSASLKTPIAGPFYVRGLVGTSFSLPSLMELYGDDPASSTYGNPDLIPEKSLNAEAGVGFDASQFKFDIGYFYQDVEDMITSVVLANGDSTYENVDGTTKIQGIEAQVSVGPFAGFTLNVSATWCDAEDEEADDQIERIPTFYGMANISYRLSDGRFGADLMTRYTGDIYERGLSPFDDVNYGDYFIADASIFYKFGQQNRHKITLRLENIFDEEYATRYNRARNSDGDNFLYQQYGMPRNVIAGYSYTF
jgi:outer membrane cobalamin receptor